MATIFPSSPSVNDVYDGYRWNGTAWIIIGIDLTEDYATQSELTTHDIDTTNVHGISDTSALETQTGAQAKADAAQTAAESYADTAVANLVDTAPSTLDTLNELAAALNDDSNFATTITNSISTSESNANAYTDNSLIAINQFAADGSVLQNLPVRIHPAEQLLKQSVLWLDAAHESAGGQEITNLGWGGSALNAQSGSTTSADSNDPKFLEWVGTNYVYISGTASNFLSVPTETAFNITGDIDLRCHVALDDWNLGSTQMFLASWEVNEKFAFFVNASGLLSGVWNDGTSNLFTGSTIPLAISDGSPSWVRWTMDVDNGSSGRTHRFFTSQDGFIWTQLGADVVQSGVTSIRDSLLNRISVGMYGAGGGADRSTGKFYRAQILNGIDGTPVLDVDCTQVTTGAATSFPALTGQTVTINRSTSGRKSVAVVSPVWLFGTDDYMQVADNALLNFGASDDFTVVATIRQWQTPTSSGRYLAKGDDDAAYSFRSNVTDNKLYARVQDDDGNFAISVPDAVSFGTLLIHAMVVDRDTQEVTAYTNSSAASAGDTTSVASLSNSEPFRIGRRTDGSTSYQDFELLAVAIFRKALTSGEIATLNTYYQGRNN
jgi:hypothetical protein